tara:strand:- start:2131 stop:2442 length:312 start_codon:yes stop_codon:yes gene_type:complete
MNAQHTPGPWRASRDKDARGWHGWRIDSASRALMVWAAWPSEEERDSNEAEATARLIAAAPDLLDALQTAAMALIGYTHRNEIIENAIVAARAAIAKATRGAK